MAAIVVSVLLIWLLHFTGFDLTSGVLVPFYVVMFGYIVLCVVQLLRAKKAVATRSPKNSPEEGCAPSRIDQQLMYSKMGLSVVTLVFALVAPLISEAYAPLWDRPMAYVALAASLLQSFREYKGMKK